MDVLHPSSHHQWGVLEGYDVECAGCSDQYPLSCRYLFFTFVSLDCLLACTGTS